MQYWKRLNVSDKKEDVRLRLLKEGWRLDYQGRHGETHFVLDLLGLVVRLDEVAGEWFLLV